MDVTEQLARAWAAVEGSGLPEHLHEVGFKAALSLQSPQSSPVAPAPTPSQATLVVPPAESPQAGAAEITAAGPSAMADPMARFAHETGIDQEVLEEVFFFHEGFPGLNGPGRKLGNNKTTQTRTVALGLTAAYHFVLGDTSEVVSAVRKECERHRCYDSINFSTTLGSTKGVNYTGPRNNKMLKAKSDTISELKAMLAAVRKTEE